MAWKLVQFGFSPIASYRLKMEKNKYHQRIQDVEKHQCTNFYANQRIYWFLGNLAIQSQMPKFVNFGKCQRKFGLFRIGAFDNLSFANRPQNNIERGYLNRETQAAESEMARQPFFYSHYSSIRILLKSVWKWSKSSNLAEIFYQGLFFTLKNVVQLVLAPVAKIWNLSAHTYFKLALLVRPIAVLVLMDSVLLVLVWMAKFVAKVLLRPVSCVLSSICLHTRKYRVFIQLAQWDK